MPSRLARVALVAGALVALSACTSATPEPTSSASEPSSAASATATAIASAEPSPSPSADESFATDPAYSVAPPASGEAPVPVDVTLTRAGVVLKVVMAAAVVEGITESDGTCTLTVTDGDVTRTATGPAAPSASSTDCGEALEVSVKDLSAGTWDVQISYESDRYAGVSDVMEVEVP